MTVNLVMFRGGCTGCTSLTVTGMKDLSLELFVRSTHNSHEKISFFFNNRFGKIHMSKNEA